MKCAIIIAANLKQIMLTGENESERQALKMITPDDDISVEARDGMFYGSGNAPECARGYLVSECQGGYLRAFDDPHSLMLVLRPKPR
jgi:hypothetical protein